MSLLNRLRDGYMFWKAYRAALAKWGYTKHFSIFTFLIYWMKKYKTTTVDVTKIIGAGEEFMIDHENNTIWRNRA